MRILFLTCDRLDYTADAVYLGLSRVLGNDNVVAYPYKASFHEEDKVPWYSRPRPGRAYSREEICELLHSRSFDLACVASFRKEGLNTFRELYGSAPFPPIAFIDGSDYADIRHELVRDFPIAVYFKRDYVWKLGHPLRDAWGLAATFRFDRGLFARTVPLPLSLVPETLPEVGSPEREIDVSFRGLASNARRPKVLELLSSMEDVRFSGAVYTAPGTRLYHLESSTLKRTWMRFFDRRRAPEHLQGNQLGPADYYREIASSKIAVAINGLGATKSLRYFEIAALGGLVVSDPPEAVIPNDFQDRTHAVFCRSDLADLQDLVRYYLKNESERQSIVAEGRRHLMKHHTCERRAEYFLEACERLA